MASSLQMVGNAAERRSAYAKAPADKHDPPSLVRATEDKVMLKRGVL